MTMKAPGRLPRRALMASTATGCALGVAALALPSSDALVEQAFMRSFGDAASAQSAAAEEPASPAPNIWLTRAEEPPLQPGTAAIGGRISMALDGGRSIELEVVAIAELQPQANGTADGERLVMVTCREVAVAGDTGRLIRLIVDADAPLTGVTARAAPRAL